MSHWRFPLIDLRSIRRLKPFIPRHVNDFYLEKKEKYSRDDLRIKIEHVLSNVRSAREYLRDRANHPYTHTECDWRKRATFYLVNSNAPMGDER